MNKVDNQARGEREITAGKRLKGRVTGVLMAKGRDFVSAPATVLPLVYEGIPGDFHAGNTRLSGGREPWYPRGTEMRNERQVSILSKEDLAAIAANLGVIQIEPGWIGANLVLEGIADLSYLPPRTLLFFEGGVTLRVDGYNAPCRLAGGEIARHLGAHRTGGAISPEDTKRASQSSEFDWTRTDMALAFGEAAHMRRGLVAWVEREGEITHGESVTARVWEQWVY
ncbi:MAG: MOSC domain-containing protein [Rhizobiaceae bacterium]